jgi:hypothetical protein
MKTPGDFVGAGRATWKKRMPQRRFANAIDGLVRSALLGASRWPAMI